MTTHEIAEMFFEACETGKGWDVCSQYCTPDASFACQAGALAEIKTLSAYCDWMRDLLIPLPDGRYELTGFAVDQTRSVVLASAVFHGTHTVDMGDMPPTGKAVASDYVYVMHLSGDKITHMTKVWNDAVALQQLGWG